MTYPFYFQLYFEFFKVGLFSIGGGLATIPFLQEMGEKTGWFTMESLANMIALSESTPGPMGINMATYVGFETGGLFGAMVATLGAVTPSLFIIIIISGFLNNFKESHLVKAVFYGIRPASAALILSAAVEVAKVAFTTSNEFGTTLYPTTIWFGLILWGLIHFTPATKLHPICFLFISALIGVFIGL